MARLTTFSRLIITLGIIAAVFFGVRYFFPNIGKSNPEQTEQSNGTTSTADRPADTDSPSSNSGDMGSSSSSSSTTAPFNYTPPQPVNGKLKGVVEMGATGFNSFIVRIDG